MNEQQLRLYDNIAIRPNYPGETVLSAARIRSFLARQALVVALPVAVALIVARAYLEWTTPIYTARAQLIIDPRLPQFIPGRKVDEVMSWDTAQVESEIAVLQSEHIAGLVVTKLKLDQDPEFRGPPSLLGKIASMLSEAEPSVTTEPDRFREALKGIGQGLSVKRVGLSYAIDITFGFPDPARAKDVANGIAQAYIADQLQSKADAARQGGDWLQGRMIGLRRQMNAASRAVQAFRASHRYDIPKSADAVVDPDVSKVDAPHVAAPDGETLDELEAAYSMYRRVYEGFLQSFTEAVQRQSFPVSEAHVLAEASLPQSRSSPRSKLIYSLAVLLGSLVGFGIALCRNALDRKLRTPEQVRKQLDLDCLGVLPNLQRRWYLIPWAGAKRLALTWARFSTGSTAAPLRRDVTARRSWWDVRRSRYFGAVLELHDKPFGKGMVTVQVCLDMARSCERLGSIGIIASGRHDGSSTVASNLAVLLADMGIKTLLIDADLEGRCLTAQLRDRAKAGLAEVLSGTADLDDAVVHFRSVSLDFLPAGVRRWRKSAHLGTRSGAFRDVLKRAAGSYEAVIVDLPPALPVASALSVSGLLDGLVLVVRSGGTTSEVLSELVNHLGRTRAKLLGFVMSRCDARDAFV